MITYADILNLNIENKMRSMHEPYVVYLDLAYGHENVAHQLLMTCHPDEVYLDLTYGREDVVQKLLMVCHPDDGGFTYSEHGFTIDGTVA